MKVNNYVKKHMETFCKPKIELDKRQKHLLNCSHIEMLQDNVFTEGVIIQESTDEIPDDT